MATKERIAKAVDNEDWQLFRKYLKGWPTRTKLKRLCDYWQETEHHYALFQSGIVCTLEGGEPCGIEVDEQEYEDRRIRLDNYIKALCRGGQLYPGESLQTMIEQHWQPRIKR